MKNKAVNDAQIVQWKGKDDQEKMMVLYNTAVEEALEEVRPIVRSVSSNQYQNIYSPSISIRDEYSRRDYDDYRPGEGIPTDDKGKIKACLDAYGKSGYGILKNIVDLMGDFAAQGVDVAYPNKKQEALIKVWFNDIVHGPERTKRFANLACKASNIIVKRDTAKIPLKVIRKFYKSSSTPNVEYENDELDTVKRELPTNYTFLHPLSVEPIAPELTMFVNKNKRRFGLIVPSDVVRKIQFPTESEKEIIESIPEDIINQIRKNSRFIELDPSKVDVYHYNKEDWEVWATPMPYCVLSDLRHLEKLKLADLSALDGVISQIRIWKIGDIEKGIKPSAAAIAKLSQILMNSSSGGFLDLVWTQDLQFQEVTSTLHNFLGDSKYVPVLNSIYTGLGIPPLFSGSSSQGSFTNNFIAIKTMIERLESIRSLIKDFWSKEFEIVQKALGLDKKISLTFDRMTLNDESSVLQLMLNLVDRGYLSIETVQEMVGATPEIEDFRIEREWKEQQKGERPPKASPFHKPEWKESWVDSFIKLGEVAPSEAGIELEEKKEGEVKPATRKPVGGATTKPKSDRNGRPIGTKDKVKRKSKEVKPRRSVNDLIQISVWASDAQKQISEVVTPNYLGSVYKKNLRQLTDTEFSELERFKFSVLASISPFEQLNSEILGDKLTTATLVVPEPMDLLLKQMITDYSVNNEVTIDKVRELQSIVYAAYNLPSNKS